MRQKEYVCIFSDVYEVSRACGVYYIVGPRQRGSLVERHFLRIAGNESGRGGEIQLTTNTDTYILVHFYLFILLFFTSAIRAVSGFVIFFFLFTHE